MMGSSEELLEVVPEPVLGAAGADAVAVGEPLEVVAVPVGLADGEADGDAVGEVAPLVAAAVGLPPAGVWADAVPPPQKKAPKPSVMAATDDSSSIAGNRSFFSRVRFIPLSIPILFAGSNEWYPTLPAGQAIPLPAGALTLRPAYAGYESLGSACITSGIR